MNENSSILHSGVSGPFPDAVEDPTTVIRASSGWAALNLKQVYLYRDLLMTLANRDVKLRYRQTSLGVLWVILQPLVAAGIFSFVFGIIGKFPSDGVPYFVFSYAGNLAWNVFNSTLTKASGVMVQNSSLVSKVFFPRLILPLSTIFGTLIDFGVAFLLMLVLMLVYHVSPGLHLLLLPVWISLLFLLAIGFGLYTSALMVSYRDVQYVLPVFTQMLFYVSPIAYASSAVPRNLQTYFFLNPLAGLLEAFRWSVLGKGDLNWGYVAYSAAVSILLFIFGAFSFKRMERNFADVI